MTKEPLKRGVDCFAAEEFNKFIVLLDKMVESSKEETT